MLAKRMIEKREASRLNPLTLKHERSEGGKGGVFNSSRAAVAGRLTARGEYGVSYFERM